MKLLGFVLCFTGSMAIYFSHPNQTILKQPLNKPGYYVGITLLIIALAVLLIQLPKLVAIYMWLITMTVVWSFLPFIPLLQRYFPHEVSKSAKDST